MTEGPSSKAGRKTLNQTAAYDAVLSRTVVIKLGDRREKRSGEKAFLIYLQNCARAGDVGASELLGEIYSIFETYHPASTGPSPITITPADKWVATDALRMTSWIERFAPRGERKIDPWLVEAALRRFGDRRLTIEDQEFIISVTRTPHKVEWSDWWDVKPMAKQKQR